MAGRSQTATTDLLTDAFNGGSEPGAWWCVKQAGSLQCIIWAFMLKSVLEVSHKPKEPPHWMVFKAPKTALEIFECSVQMMPAPCYGEMEPVQAFLMPAGLVGKEIQLRGVPGQLPSHMLSTPR